MGATTRITKDVKEKAEVLQRYFMSVFTKEETNPPRIPKKTAHIMNDIVISREQVAMKLKELNPSKSQGPDHIHPKVLKELYNILDLPLSIIFNSSVQNTEIPKDWKESIVTPIYKKGPKNDPGNYRPVSLTSIPSKVLESIIKDQIIDFITHNNLLSPAQ